MVSSKLTLQHKMLLTSMLVLVSSTYTLGAVDLDTCRLPLGMHSGEIKDSQLSASSTYSEDSLSARHSRLSHNEGAGAWCPGNPINNEYSDEYLEINFLKLTVISMVATQGRDHPPTGGREFSSHFKFGYFRRSKGLNDEWLEFKYKTAYNQTVLLGNTNPSEAVGIAIDPPIIAERLRIYPYNPNPQNIHVCMRTEVYGCPYEDHLLAYSMPKANIRLGTPFTDRTYDGDSIGGMRKYGLGQLTDGKIGGNDFYDDLGYGRSYEWVGWSRKLTPDLEIVFHFDSVRNFTTMKVHTSNQFAKEVSVFESVLLWFGLENGNFLPAPLLLTVAPDNQHQEAKYIILNLQHRIGKFVKCQFQFANTWMMISEVSFESTKVSENYTVPPDVGIVPYEPIPVIPTVKPTGKNEGDKISVPVKTQLVTKVPPVLIYKTTLTTAAATKDKLIGSANKGSSSNSALIVGVLVAVIGILIIVILLLVWRQLKIKRVNKAPKRVEQVRFDSNTVQITNNRLDNLRDAPHQENLTYDTALLSSVDGPQYDEPWGQRPILFGRALPELPLNNENSGSSSMIYAEPDITKSTGHSKSNILLQHYAETDVINALNIQGVSGNNIYSVPSTSLEKLTNIDHVVPEIPVDKIKFKEVLGDGQFGQVHLCEIDGLQQLTRNGFPFDKDLRTLVAVKMLTKNASKNARSDFEKEVKIMSQLNHINIVKLLGVCTGEEPWCMVVEYMGNGDLNQFLFDRELDTEINGASNAQPISFETLLYMATQIADGMKYLSSMDFVHRDLATRNCLVGDNYSIRIADFGMSRSLYSADYYRIEGKAILPIRWMAWECILYGKFSTSSDMWAYGITLWEIFSLAKEQPFSNMSDQQVIENTGEYYRNSGQHVLLVRPKICPKDIYDIMTHCWRRDAGTRPRFDYVHSFLLQKNRGYDPAAQELAV
ncbi:discoidin domain-containing receptor 2-like isoform X2 [Glandiceps talaboti]